MADLDRMREANNALFAVDHMLIESFEPTTDEGRLIGAMLERLTYAVRLIYVELADHMNKIPAHPETAQGSLASPPNQKEKEGSND